ncbi:MAG: phospho-N-acetylmuramoyl-pentapeptide-transferase [Sphaerochaeta sp.]|nr:phospho-N-acetylmuramoyl-pentapeptide-transferase [Sphaerochaeta sp.]
MYLGLVVDVLMGFSLTFVISKALLSLSHTINVAIKPELAEKQSKKQGTPSIGGIAFCLGTLISFCFSSSRALPSVYLPLLALLVFGLIGLLDDLAKPRHQNGDGISSLTKLLLQVSGAVLLLFVLYRSNSISTMLHVPFLKGLTLQLGAWYYVFSLFYILYFVNAVNITDGLDALAAGSSLPLLLLLVFFSFTKGSTVSLALIGSLLAFLWYNRAPARYFMGDCGSHALGGYMAISALLLHTELVMLVASGLFLVEFATSLIQIISIRSTGNKVFSIAPLHHAYELKGVKESNIVKRFTLSSWMFTLVALLLFLGTNW